MLRELRVENFAIIDCLDLSFGPGLNVLTGETGAGKSIIVDAFALLLGARADLDQIRTGSDQAVVEAVIALPEKGKGREVLLDQGLIEPEGGELILRRVISRSGRGRILANDHLVTLSALQEISRSLVDIHGQHDHQSLLFPDCQLDFLDAYGRLHPLRETYQVLYQQWKALQAELESFQKLEQEKDQRLEYLQYQMEEIRSAHLQSGEDIALQQEREVLAHSQKLSQHAEGAYQLLYESEHSAIEKLSKAASHLKEILSIDARFSETFSLWEAALTQVREVADQLRHYKEEIQQDPDRLQQIEERLYGISKLKKKYGGTIEEILKRLSDLNQERSALEHYEERILALQQACHEQREKVGKLATQLSGQRARTAKRFKAEVERELQYLGMPQTDFSARMEPLEGLTESGSERIDFMIATQSAEESKPLNKVASGGELSRIMLAIKTILAGVDQVSILVFDEVDAGVGGAVAEAVGRRLKAIAGTRQVFCITHLPQIAMLADEHYRVEKVTQRGRIVTQVRKLDPSERVQEIARMLGGKEITAITLRHAKELLNRSGVEEPHPRGARILRPERK